MRTEEQAKPDQRFLFADERWSDKTIEIWQAETAKRLKDKPKDDAYHKYINWVRQENEIAVFTLYAYADFKIPKRFDIIFELSKPNNFIQVEYELTQSIYEGWLPINSIEDGHKHTCIFRFNTPVPSIFGLLNECTGRYSNIPKSSPGLGFCISTDFPEIKSRKEKQMALKLLHGDKWWEHDDEL